MFKAVRVSLSLGMLIVFSGCVISPGMNTLDLQRQGEVVIGAGDKAQRVKIKPINAELIVQLRQGITSSDQLSNETTTAYNTQVYSSTASTAEIKEQARISAVDNYVYRVGPADILTIIVWDHPELTIPAGAERSAEQAGTVVENDGTIYYPFAGVVEVAGRTLPEIRQILTEKLGDYIEDVKLDVRMAEYNNKRVYVVGEVKQPSVKTITNIPPTMIEIINSAGGFTENADTQMITLTRNKKTYRVDIQSLYEQGDLSQNLLLQSGDVVNIWDRSLNKVYVLGEVNQPGSYFVNKGRKSLAEALSDAGGVNPNTSNPGQVFVFRQPTDGGQPAVFHLDARSPDSLLLADQFPLQSRDLIYVDTANVVRWSRVIQNISGTLTTLNAASQTNFPLFKGDR